MGNISLTSIGGLLHGKFQLIGGILHGKFQLIGEILHGKYRFVEFCMGNIS